MQGGHICLMLPFGFSLNKTSTVVMEEFVKIFL